MVKYYKWKIFQKYFIIIQLFEHFLYYRIFFHLHVKNKNNYWSSICMSDIIVLLRYFFIF